MNTRDISKAALVAVLMVWSLIASAKPATIVPSKTYVTVPVKVNTTFSGLRTNTAIDIEYTVGPQKVQLYVPDNLAKYVKVSVAGGDLTVSYSENMNIHGDHDTRLIVSAPDVSRFTVGSAGDITIKSNLDTKKEVEMVINSAGDIKARSIKAPTVRLNTRSAGDITTGEITADRVVFTVNSAGDITTGAVRARETATITTNSAGDIDIPSVLAGSTLKLAVNSAGDIKVKEASADDVTLSSSSSGDVKVADLAAINATISASSAGDVTVSGICSYADIRSSNAGDVDARNLKATNVRARVSSVGGIKCNAVDELNAERRGMGTIRYAGNPAQVTVSSTSRDDDGVYPL